MNRCPKCGKRIHHVTVFQDTQGILVVQVHHSMGAYHGTTHCSFAARSP